MSKTIEITRIEDIQPGDRVTLVRNDDDDTTTVSGTVRAVVDDRLCCISAPGLSFWVGDGPGDWHVTVATREVPDAPPLPTEEGSVIVNATIRGEAGHTAFLDDSGDWRSLRPAGSPVRLHHPEHITAWEPARIVPESEVGRTGVEAES